MKPPAATIERIAAAWLARRDGPAWSPADQSALTTWLDEDTAHRVAFLRLQAAWREAGRLKALAAGQAAGPVPARGAWWRSPYFKPSPRNQRPIRPTGRRGEPSGRRTRRVAWSTAMVASLLVVMVAGGLLWWREFGHIDRGTWRTSLGGQQMVHLADGSTATLASETELHAALSWRERDLHLVRGEAYFDVAKDPSRPFVVRAEGYRVIAVGTRFDVRRVDDGMRVVVTRGVVRLQSAQDPEQAATELPTGSIAVVKGDNVVVRHQPLTQVTQYLSWRNGYVVFHDTPLVDAVREFNRYNTRKIVIADPSLDELKVGGNFRLDNSGAFVRLLQAVFPVHAEQRGERTVLSRRGLHKGAH